jgi:hypothetical protein
LKQKQKGKKMEEEKQEEKKQCDRCTNIGRVHLAEGFPVSFEGKEFLCKDCMKIYKREIQKFCDLMES